jgi:hypothetical protein
VRPWARSLAQKKINNNNNNKFPTLDVLFAKQHQPGKRKETSCIAHTKIVAPCDKFKPAAFLEASWATL